MLSLFKKNISKEVKHIYFSYSKFSRESFIYKLTSLGIFPIFVSNFNMALDLPNTDGLVFDTFSSSVAFANITGAVSILFLFISILLSYSGIKFVKYFDLENKFPKLAKLIRFRNTLQTYSIVLHIITIFMLLFGIIILNIFIILSNEDIENVIKNLDELKDSGDILTNRINEVNGIIADNISELSKRSKGGGSFSVSNFISYYSWRIDEIIPEIDLNDITQSVAVVNFLGGLIIFLCLSTIVSAIYGNKLIIYFDLENRFPSLAKFIRLRIKFQNYTILFNFFLLTVVLINQMIINSIVLFNSI